LAIKKKVAIPTGRKNNKRVANRAYPHGIPLYKGIRGGKKRKNNPARSIVKNIKHALMPNPKEVTLSVFRLSIIFFIGYI